MKILLIHQNFPGQYRTIVPNLQKQGHQLLSISSIKQQSILGVKNHFYTLAKGNTSGLHPWLTTTESCMLRGDAVAKLAKKLYSNGYYPDVILAHSGWGESLFVKKIWPSSKLISYFEYYYREQGGDTNFDPEFPSQNDLAMKLHIRNTHMLLNLIDCDIGLSPTKWQQNLFPSMFKPKIKVIHDGIDTTKLTPSDSAWIQLKAANLTLQKKDEVITFVNRNFEPLRGYHKFMRALPDIMDKRPSAHIVLVGGDQTSYSGVPKNGKSYKHEFLDEVKDKLDMSRIHFVGRVPYSVFINLLRISSVHVYLTYPFVLSWSLLEAMSIGCLIVGSKTPPVEEVIEHNKEGLLVDFFSKKELVDTICKVLEHPSDYHNMRLNARKKIVEYYDFNKICFPQLQHLIEQ